MKRFLVIAFVLCGSNLHAETPAPNPELDAAKARIAWLEQTLAAQQRKTQACFDIYGADMTLNNLAKQEPAKAAPAEQPNAVIHK